MTLGNMTALLKKMGYRETPEGHMERPRRSLEDICEQAEIATWVTYDKAVNWPRIEASK